MVRDPGRAGGDAGGAADDLAGLDDQYLGAFLCGGQRGHQARAARTHDHDVDLAGDALAGPTGPMEPRCLTELLFIFVLLVLR